MSDRLMPLRCLAPERLLGVRGVLTDIDDTLTRDGAIEAEALAALQGLQRAGVPVIAVTGRPAGWSEPFALQWPVAAIVAENGGVTLRRTERGLRRDFAQPAAQRAANAVRLQACLHDVIQQVPGAQPARDSAGRLTDIAVDHSEHTMLDAARIAAVQALMRAHGLHATVSSIHINGWLGGHTKWSGAQAAVRGVFGMALDPQAWLYVGDSTNDELMFERLPLSAGVANIARFVPQLRCLPAYLTVGERGAGFAEVARAVIVASATATPPQ
jgi:HAD superfamily hydrolase (TIGR01484 family)